MAHTASFTNTTRSGATNGTAIPGMIRQAMNLMSERLAAHRARAQMRAELSTYTTRELADLGMGRGDIEDVVHNRFAR